jgi:glycosyltransferase involved in cell wall biosynthesis
MPKVLHIGCGFYTPSARGMVLYQDSLMEETANQGWDVTFFVGGKWNLKKKSYLQRWQERKIKFIGLVNSPNTLHNYHANPLGDCQNEVIEKLTKQVIEEESPDVVHIHDLGTHAASIIDIIKEINIPMVKSINSHWDICPESNLLYQGKERCLDFQEGKRCIECLATFPKYDLLPHRIKESLGDNMLFPIAQATWRAIKKFKKGIPLAKSQITDFKLPYPASSYLYRRNFFIERLNKIEAISCPTGVGKTLISYGVERERIKPILYSSKGLETINSRSLSKGHYPIVFGFMGGDSYLKGIHILLEAFSRLDQSKTKLIIYGVASTGLLAQYQGGNIEYRGFYKRSDLNQILSEIDIGVVPSLSECCPLLISEFLTARVPVIGSAVGGIPDLLAQGRYGFLINPGDVEDLADKMNRFLREPLLIIKFQNEIKPPLTMREHTQEMIKLYENIRIN